MCDTTSSAAAGGPRFNGVVRVRSAAGTDVAAVRNELAGVPWSWWVGPDSPPRRPRMS